MSNIATEGMFFPASTNVKVTSSSGAITEGFKA
jgi:hypothetical protein